MPPEVLQTIGTSLLNLPSRRAETDDNRPQAIDNADALASLALTARPFYAPIQPTALVARAKTIEYLAGEQQRESFRHMLECFASPGALDTVPIGPGDRQRWYQASDGPDRPTIVYLGGQDRSDGLAELARQIVHVQHGTLRLHGFAMISMSVPSLSTDALKAPVLAALGRAISALPSAHHKASFDAVLGAAQQLSPQECAAALVGIAEGAGALSEEDSPIALYACEKVLETVEGLTGHLPDPHLSVSCEKILGQLGFETSRVPEELQRTYFDRVLQAALTLPQEAQVAALMGMTKDLEYLFRGESPARFHVLDSILQAVDNLHADLRAPLLAELADKLMDLPMNDRTPSAFSDVVSASAAGPLGEVVTQVTDSYDGTVALLQRSDQLGSEGKALVLEALVASLEVFEDNTDWMLELARGVLHRSGTLDEEVLQARVQRELSLRSFALAEPDLFLAAWVACARTHDALVDRLDQGGLSATQTETLIKARDECDAVHARMQTNSFSLMASEDQEDVLARLEQHGVVRSAFLALQASGSQSPPSTSSRTPPPA